MTWNYNRPPIYAPDAVATPAGWVNPNTGEILVAIRGLSNRVQADTADITILGFSEPATKKVKDTAQPLNISVNWNERVRVTGTPRLAITVGGVAKFATYASGSSTNKLVFRYITEPGVRGAVVAVSPIDLNGGTIKDTDGAQGDVHLAFTATLPAGIEVIA